MVTRSRGYSYPPGLTIRRALRSEVTQEQKGIMIANCNCRRANEQKLDPLRCMFFGVWHLGLSGWVRSVGKKGPWSDQIIKCRKIKQRIRLYYGLRSVYQGKKNNKVLSVKKEHNKKYDWTGCKGLLNTMLFVFTC